MEFKANNYLLLTNNYDFISSACSYFNESAIGIEQALNQIISITTEALNTQYFFCKKADEILKFAKQCSKITFNGFHNTSIDFAQKGRGINSELFGVALVYKIETIAQNTKTQNKTINHLMAINTPIFLAALYKMGQKKGGIEIDFLNLLQEINKNEN